jgi:hypothetical protein
MLAIDALFLIGMLASFAVSFAGIGLCIRGLREIHIRDKRLAKRRAAYRINVNRERDMRHKQLQTNDKQTRDELNKLYDNATTNYMRNNYYKKPIHELLKTRG